MVWKIFLLKWNITVASWKLREESPLQFLKNQFFFLVLQKYNIMRTYWKEEEDQRLWYSNFSFTIPFRAFRGAQRLIICACNRWSIGKTLKLIVLSYWNLKCGYLETAFSKTTRAVAQKFIDRSGWNFGRFLSITLSEGCTSSFEDIA